MDCQPYVPDPILAEPTFAFPVNSSRSIDPGQVNSQCAAAAATIWSAAQLSSATGCTSFGACSWTVYEYDATAAWKGVAGGLQKYMNPSFPNPAICAKTQADPAFREQCLSGAMGTNESAPFLQYCNRWDTPQDPLQRNTDFYSSFCDQVMPDGTPFVLGNEACSQWYLANYNPCPYYAQSAAAIERILGKYCGSELGAAAGPCRCWDAIQNCGSASCVPTLGGYGRFVVRADGFASDANSPAAPALTQGAALGGPQCWMPDCQATSLCMFKPLSVIAGPQCPSSCFQQVASTQVDVAANVAPQGALVIDVGSRAQQCNFPGPAPLPSAFGLPYEEVTVQILAGTKGSFSFALTNTQKDATKFGQLAYSAQSWLAPVLRAQQEGTLAPGESVDVQVVVDATSLQPGLTYATLSVSDPTGASQPAQLLVLINTVTAFAPAPGVIQIQNDPSIRLAAPPRKKRQFALVLIFMLAVVALIIVFSVAQRRAKPVSVDIFGQEANFA